MEGLTEKAVKEEGFWPVFLYGGWRVAVLNYCQLVELDRLYRLERHRKTDEVFLLLEGRACLFLGGSGDTLGKTEAAYMEKGHLYNVAKDYWHHILMAPGASVLIVENADTGPDNTDYARLSSGETAEMIRWAEDYLKEKKTDG